MLFFISKGYFASRNCRREIEASLNATLPLVLLHEQQEDKGGGSLEALKAECREEMRSRIFDGQRTPFTWHRISHYQNLTLKLIATEMLNQSLLDSDVAGGSNKEVSLVLPGEINLADLAMPQPVVLWCSAANPGATELAQELAGSLASGGAAIRVVDRKPNVQALIAAGESAVMLLYLNEDTWVEQSKELERDVRATNNFGHGHGSAAARPSRTGSRLRHHRRPSLGESEGGVADIKIVLVHENDRNKGGCEFGTLFATTPQELIEAGIYKDIAIALHTPPHRAVSLALVAHAFGATKDAAQPKLSIGLSASVISQSQSVISRPRAQPREQKV